MNGLLYNPKRKYKLGLTKQAEWTGTPHALAATLNSVAGKSRYPTADNRREFHMFGDAVGFLSRAGIAVHVVLPEPEIVI